MDIVYIKSEEIRILVICNKNDQILDILNKSSSVQAFKIEEKIEILLDLLNLDVIIEEVDRNINKGLVLFKLLSDEIYIHIMFNLSLIRSRLVLLSIACPLMIRYKQFKYSFNNSFKSR